MPEWLVKLLTEQGPVAVFSVLVIYYLWKGYAALDVRHEALNQAIRESHSRVYQQLIDTMHEANARLQRQADEARGKLHYDANT